MSKVRAVESFQAPGNAIAKGDEFDSDSPLVLACPHLFEPVPPPKPKPGATPK